MATKRFAFQHSDGPVVEIYDEASDIRLGNAPKTLITLATKLLGTTPGTTDLAITAFVDAGYRVSIGSDRTTKTI